ncbi:MAG: hypothetical protein GX288_00525 [Clostridiales bacterium]|nr:hypothetical protein [Clostridiales bacterium]
MSFKPIDVMKSQGVSHYKHIESQRSHHEQVQISKQLQDNIREERTKTTQTAKSENNEFRYDAKEKGNGSYPGYRSYNRKKDNKKDNKNDKETSKPAKSGGIDILI